MMAKAIVSARCVRELASRNALIARAGDMNRVHTAMELDIVGGLSDDSPPDLLSCDRFREIRTCSRGRRR